MLSDVAANMIGRGNAQRAARQVFGVAQIRLLNLHILLTIFDEVSNTTGMIIVTNRALLMAIYLL